MSITALTSTTLSAAIDNKQSRIALASTTGINGLGSLTAPQSIIVVDSEAMLVLNVPVSGVVEVTRGVNGTAAKAHVSGASVWFGPKTAFGSIEDSEVGLTGDAGIGGVLPAYRLPLGARKRYGGKEYILVDFTATVHSGVTVGISNDGNFTAAPLTNTHKGSVGVVAEGTSSSDQWGWVQIYGSVSAQLSSGDSALTSAYIPVAASSVSSPDAGLAAVVNTTSTAQPIIFGMFITGVATTNVTSAASTVGVSVPVFLDYPYVVGYNTDTGTS